MPPLAKTAVWTQELPGANPPKEMAICHLPTGTYGTRAVFAVRGKSFRN